MGTLRLRLALTTTLALAACGPKAADNPPPKGPMSVSIATGAEGGTYYKIGQGIASLLPADRYKTTVATGAGSIVNVAVCNQAPNYFGLTQLDVLMVMQNDKDLKAAAEKVKLVMPLYMEEVHILVRRDAGINDLADLRGKRVHTGPKLSGTMLTVAILLDQFKMSPADLIVNQDGVEQALQKLLLGGLDAMFYTGGQPVPLFASIPAGQGASLKLLSLTQKQVDDISNSPAPYYPQTIPAKTYPWQEEGVLTVAGPCGLVTSQESDPDLVALLAKRLATESSRLTSYHTKFAQVNVNVAKELLQKGFPTHPAAAKTFQ
jgi:TRAP transporter TAXI family solute receptor